MRAIVLVVAALLPVCGLSAGVAYGQSATDPFNAPNVTVTSHTDVIGSSNNNLPASDGIYNIFGATNPAVEANDRAIFVDANPAFVNFTISGLAAGQGIGGVTLYEQSDGATDGASRGVSEFRLLADADNNGSYETTLVSGVNPTDDVNVANTYTFAPTAATQFRAEFVPNAGVQFQGPRVFELDGIAAPVPEPAAASLTALAGMYLMARRRRAGAGGA